MFNFRCESWFTKKDLFKCKNDNLSLSRRETHSILLNM